MHKYIIHILLFSIGFNFTNSLSAANSFSNNQLYVIEDFYFYCDTTQNSTLEDIIEVYKKGKFLKSGKDIIRIKHHTPYWVRFEVKNNLPGELTWMLEFNTQVSHAWIYCLDSTGKFIGKPINSVAINNINRNKTLVPIPDNKEISFYIKIYNRDLVNANISKMSLTPVSKYEKKLSMQAFLVGITFGGYIIMFIYSLQICLTLRRKEYLFYSLYIVCNLVFAVFGSFITDKYLFASDPWAAFNLHGVILLAHLFYILFVRYFIGPDTIPVKIDQYFFKPFMWFIIIANPIVCIISFFNISLFKQLFDVVILADAVLGAVLVILLLQIKLQPVRFILIGSLIMIVFGVIGQLADFFEIVTENYFYNIGVLIELLLFSYAITLKQKHLEDVKKEKEKDVALLKVELSGKYRELTQKAINITQKEHMLNSLSQKLMSINNASTENNKKIRDLLLDLDIYQKQNSWTDFENYFTKVHPEFFIVLKKNHPDLTSNEIRLCAMLRLALNTKEIASITGKTPKSIDVMRNRIRQKMGLNRSDRLYDKLTTFNNL